MKDRGCERIVRDDDTGRKRYCRRTAAWQAHPPIGLRLCDQCRGELLREYEFDLRFAKAELKALRKMKPVKSEKSKPKKARK